MSYQIRKGWPHDGAIDEIVNPAAGVVLTDGMIGAIDTDGKCIPCDYLPVVTDPVTPPTPATAIPCFLIDTDTVRGKFTGIMSPCVIEVDSTQYVAGVYAPQTQLTTTGGKFAPLAANEKVVGKVLAFNAVTGVMRVLWTGSLS